MSYPQNKVREAATLRSQKRKQQATIRTAGASIFVILAITAIWFLNRPTIEPVEHFVAYDASLVVSDKPFQAVHEMSGLDADSIPFLPQDGPQPKIVIDQNFFDFEQVGATQVIKHEFVIANEGDAPLTLSRAFSTCACTTAYFTTSVIPPGKIAIMTLTFDAGYHDVRGQTVRRGIIIESNDPTQPETEIWTQATVRTTP